VRKAAAAGLVASLALLALVLTAASSGAATVAAAASAASATASGTTASAVTTALTVSCYPVDESTGSCYEAGQFCPEADLNESGVAANGASIACETASGEQQPTWETCTPVVFPPASPGPATSAATEIPSCPPAPAGGATSTPAPTGAATSAAATPSASTPVSAPATGGGTGPRPGDGLAAAGGAVMVLGGGLILLSRWRSRRRPA
jgi:hypothetical protein